MLVAGAVVGVTTFAAAVVTVAVAVVIVIAYYSSVASYRSGLDPDTYGVPIVTSTVDFLGALALVLAIVTFVT